MVRGEILKRSVEIRPAENGGFIVLSVARDRGIDQIVAAFTTIGDLVIWFTGEAQAFADERLKADYARDKRGEAAD